MSVEVTRCRQYRQGCVGCRRTYKCRGCGEKFQVDRLTPLPRQERLCPLCRDGEANAQ